MRGADRVEDTSTTLAGVAGAAAPSASGVVVAAGGRGGCGPARTMMVGMPAATDESVAVGVATEVCTAASSDGGAARADPVCSRLAIITAIPSPTALTRRTTESLRRVKSLSSMPSSVCSTSSSTYQYHRWLSSPLQLAGGRRWWHRGHSDEPLRRHKDSARGSLHKMGARGQGTGDALATAGRTARCNRRSRWARRPCRCQPC